MSPPRRRNHPKAPPHGHFRSRPQGAPDGLDWLWGRHAVRAALANPRRPAFRRLVLAPGRALELEPPAGQAWPTPEVMEPPEIARLLPQGAVHQGFALLAAAPEPADLEEIATPAEGLILVLDQVTDPQNIGTILRSAAAFGARGVVLQDRRAPVLSGALAKAAVGAVDMIPTVRAVNLSRALEQLGALGWRSVGLAGEAEAELDQVLDGGPTVLVLGSEGEGLRRLVGEHCDALAKIAMPGGFESLNVAQAATVSLYEAAKARRRGSAGG